MAIHLFTIGFTKKGAERFFTVLRESRVRRVLDIRLNNVSQLAGFAKRDDLKFFLREICNADYLHVPECAPTKEILDKYKKKHGDWEEYEACFLPLIEERKIETLLTADLLDYGCLLCSEPTPEKCHRRLVASYLEAKIPNLQVKNL
ncbi:MAG TPA: DUF488 domain-containing protein [Candidatus Hydrogenedentes bacterium]|nr:DUF488 domain-containing protein [Candidatus Hydrogenedentota bacterium]HOV74949.1 DUF488 domain-containing protein [Candidatus Hydrogenedentota bacterium]HPC16719.1 DUF488 domain-containing protein [Candidatus Hydrogenedentota bacterium]HRT21908.1 DUF488 domain-containing protein [Candidatus Hydrogenedentota bacterium]HRT65899.1 DUF488 domain-containing protein [Candidatus Hydrogenedentota bacterium]